MKPCPPSAYANPQRAVVSNFMFPRTKLPYRSEYLSSQLTVLQSLCFVCLLTVLQR